MVGDCALVDPHSSQVANVVAESLVERWVGLE